MKKILWILLCTAILLPGTAANSAPVQTGSSMAMNEAKSALADGGYEKAFAGYHDAAIKDNNALAQFSLGLFYQNGWGRAIDKAAACQWFEKAALSGIPTAQHLTGICFEEGAHRPADSAQAAFWYQKAAQAGHIHSYCHLGNLLMTGNGAAKDPIKALELCHPAALQGSVPAQIWMGKFYLQGDPSIRNMPQAYYWFTTAAQKQAPEALYYLGMIMQQSTSEAITAEKARLMFEQAAAHKYIPAYFQAGKHFYHAKPDPETGRLSAEHLAKAYLWLAAALQRSQDPEEIIAAKAIMQEILVIMPETWLATLNQKVTQHLQEQEQH
ncbi:MAG: tetratricopeptide repeat protein [Nitrosomonas sp.]|jgi:TPR repeat protein|nr:sel1 repeat family protein [Nitrosomonas sp.]HQV88361.1 tetratricopeptide repeat protein [Nitrosomonas sp.]